MLAELLASKDLNDHEAAYKACIARFGDDERFWHTLSKEILRDVSLHKSKTYKVGDSTIVVEARIVDHAGIDLIKFNSIDLIQSDGTTKREYLGWHASTNRLLMEILSNFRIELTAAKKR